jgi:hypothetical protein
MVTRALVLATCFITGLTFCGWFRDATGLTAELEARYPGNRIEIDDVHENGARRVAVKIVAPSFEEDLNVAEEAREVAESVRRRYELGGRSDTVLVNFRSERRVGPFASSREARFVYPVSELSASD